MGDRLNTAEYDSKGRCVRHPAIRLRKKKMFGGWKIIIGHCPECCLDEMRRVRDEIGAESSDHFSGVYGEEQSRVGSGSGAGGYEGGDRGHHRSDQDRRVRKEKKKKSKHGKRRSGDRDRDRRSSRRQDESSADGGSQGQHVYPPPQHGQHHHPHPQDGSAGTGSTAMNSSLDGNGSLEYSQPYRQAQSHLRQDAYHHQQQQHHNQRLSPPPQHHHQQHPPQYSQQHPPAPPPPRTMVLSMAFTDQQTGQRGTYTGQVNSINHKPDGKGTVYYSNGSIAEGSWSNGVLMESEDDVGSQNSGSLRGSRGGGGVRSRSSGRTRSGGSVGSHGSRDPPNVGGGAAPHPNSSSRSRSRRSNNAPPSPQQPFTGNLDRLDQLGGVRRVPPPPGGPRGSASVQSWNSRGSYGSRNGAASVQDYHGMSPGGHGNFRGHSGHSNVGGRPRGQPQYR